MKKANLVLMAALAAVGLAGVTGGSLLPVSTAVAAAKEKTSRQAEAEPRRRQAAGGGPDGDEREELGRSAGPDPGSGRRSSRRPRTTRSWSTSSAGTCYLQKKDYVKSAEIARARARLGLRPGGRQAAAPARTDAAEPAEQAVPQGAADTATEYLKLNPGDTEIALQLAQARYLSERLRGRQGRRRARSSPSSAEARRSRRCWSRCAASYELKDERRHDALAREAWCASTRSRSTGKTCSTTSCTARRTTAACARCTG